MRDVERYYKTLELEPGASLEDVHQGYKDLATVWHPDRFASNPRLQQKAQEKFQQINEAHEQLRTYLLLAQAQRHKFPPKSPPTYSSVRTPTHNAYHSHVYQAYAQDYAKTVSSYTYRSPVPRREACMWLD